MSRNIYALVVGIDNYKSLTIPALQGCENDVIAMERFLNSGLINSDDKLYIRKLINHQATRQAIIDSFREHLCQATSTDVALFYFSGHGSQEEAAEIFWHIEPDHLNETLVCWDSRTDHIWDLADKELSWLASEISQSHPHFIVILDCCHSGGAFRSHQQHIGTRSVTPNLAKRPLSSFIFADKLNLSNWQSLSKDYILLAACRDTEEAREHYSQKRGVFSYFLLDSLQRHGNLTYRQALKRTNALVKSFYPTQSPQIETTNSSLLDQPFFGGAINPVSYFTASYDSANGWNIDGGAVHGIATSQRIRLALFPTGVKNIRNLQDAVAVADVVEVLPQLSKINIAGEGQPLDPQLIYKAIVISPYLSNLNVYLEGAEIGVNFARQAIQQACFGETSLYINEVDTDCDADYYLQAISGQYRIFRKSDNQELMPPIPDYNVESASLVIRSLEHIARWMNIATLSNPDNSEIQGAILMQVYQESEISDYQINLEYKDWLQPPLIRIKLTNISDKAVYCALLNLTELFAIIAISFGCSPGVWLEPCQEVWVQEGKYFPITIPQHLLQQGVTVYKDILKLLVSTSEFDARLLEQPSIDENQKRSYNVRNYWYDIHQVISRAITFQPETKAPQALNSWATQEILILTSIPNLLSNNEEFYPKTKRLLLTGKLSLIGILSLASLFIVLGFVALKKTREDKLYQPTISSLIVKLPY